MTTVITPSNPYDFLDQEGASEAKEKTPTKDDHTTKKNYSMARVDRPTNGDLGFKKLDTDKSYNAVLTPHTNLRAPHVDKGKYFWDRVKRVVRSAPP